VAAAEKAHDAILPIFRETIKNAEKQAIDRKGGGDAKTLKLQTVPVPVKHADTFTVEEFITQHAIPGKPVVIRGGAVQVEI
jgi:hypothetical protein